MHPCFIIRGADVLITMDDTRREIKGGDILVRDGVIEAVGTLLYDDDAQIVDARGSVVTPGLINTHHHLFQTMTRAVPVAQNAGPSDWARHLYPIWARYTPEHTRISAMVALAELAFSGCSMTADHQYVYPNGSRLDDTIEAAITIGLRLQATRGCISLDAADGGHIPDALIQREENILDDSLRVIEAYHDLNAGAMTRVGVAPYSPYSVSTDLMRNLAVLARDKGVMMHSHLAESDQDVAYCLEKHGCRPSQYVHDLGWTGPDVWHAHCVQFEASDIDLFAQTGTGVAHCPSANCRLGAGVAPIRALRDAGVKVGLGVDGSASNEVSNLVTEARQSMLLQRVVGGADKMSPREALELATRGGAQVLGREDVGQIVPGMRADIAIWDISDIETAGSWDPAALLLAGPTQVKHLFVDGRHVINDGWLATLDIARVLTRHSRLSQGLQNA